LRTLQNGVKLLINGERNKMGQLKSDKTSIGAPIEKIYNFLSDFNNFKDLMPDQVQNWKSTEETCSFDVSGMGQMSLKQVEKIPFSKIRIIPEAATKLPFTFELICLLEKVNENESKCEFIFDHEMPMMISMMASRPLQNLVDILVKKLKEHCEKPGF
jgi:carbon monoxide dehydrogenase subunit G